MICNIEDVKLALGITGNALDLSITPYIEDVEMYLTGSGVPPDRITPGLVARGVSDTWNYGSGDGDFSESFLQMAVQRKW